MVRFICIVLAWALQAAIGITPKMLWQWSYPQPSGNNLIHVSLQDSIHGVIVADNGEVLVTDDRGQVWKSKNAMIAEDFLASAIAFDVNTLVSVSSRGYVRRSIDRGASWNQVGEFNTNLTQIHACGDSVALAVGMEGIILRTSDQGATWTQIFQDSAEAFLLGIYCAGSQAFAVGESGSVFRSRDGGLNWESMTRPLNEYLTGVAFSDSLHGYAISDKGRIAETRDAGNSWKTSTLDSMNFFWNIQYLDSRWRIVGSSGSIWTSSGHGGTWVRTDSLTPVDMTCSFLLGDSGGLVVGNNGVILKQDEKDGSWKSKNMGIGHHLDGLAKVTSDRWIAFGSPGRILKTADAGASWQERIVSPDDIRFFGGAFQGNRGILAGDSATIIRTDDAGDTWEITQTPGKKSRLYGVAWKGVNTVVAVGESSTVLRSVDAGRTWHVTPLPEGVENPTLSAVTFLPDGSALIVGYNGTILRSSDNGTSWSRIPSPTQEHLFACAFKDETHGIAVGSGGVALTTRTGGLTWSLQTLGIEDDFTYGVAWLHGDTAIAVGDWSHGYFVSLTVNSGVTWEYLPLPTWKNLWAISSLGSGKAAFMGQDGAILIGSIQSKIIDVPASDSLGGTEKFSIQRGGSMGQLLVHMTLAKDQRVKISAFALDGKRIGSLYDEHVAEGQHTLRLPYSRRGPCLIRIQGEDKGSGFTGSKFLPF